MQKVCLVNVICWFQKLQQVKMVGLNLQCLLQHPPHSHTRHLQFMTRTVHRFLRTAKKRLPHMFHACFWHTWLSCTFSFKKAPHCLKLLIPASNAIGRWRINVELSPECLLNRNNWFLYVFFCVFPRRQIKFCRRFGTLCQSKIWNQELIPASQIAAHKTLSAPELPLYLCYVTDWERRGE
jgi:hypothetical protein